MFPSERYGSGLSKTPQEHVGLKNMLVWSAAEKLFTPALVMALILQTMTYAETTREHVVSPPNGSRSVKENPLHQSSPAVTTDQSVSSEVLQPPEDPCLPSPYKDWYDFSKQAREGDVPVAGRTRIVIDRSMFHLLIEEYNPGTFIEEIYATPVGLGYLRSPTPEGNFIINHIFCYTDVLFFSASQEAVPNLYNGFFAPLLECDVKGNCRRFNDLGIHGFAPDARPDASIRPETFGAVSAGCVRLPDPCSFKRHLLRRVELGPLKRNERGSYHWLKRPLEVIIVNGYTRTDPAAGFFDSVTSGLDKLGAKLKEMLQSLER